MKGASVSKRVQVVRERVCGYSVDDGDVELSCEGKDGGRMAVARFRVLQSLILASSRSITSVALPSFKR